MEIGFGTLLSNGCVGSSTELRPHSKYSLAMSCTTIRSPDAVSAHFIYCWMPSCLASVRVPCVAGSSCSLFKAPLTYPGHHIKAQAYPATGKQELLRQRLLHLKYLLTRAPIYHSFLCHGCCTAVQSTIIVRSFAACFTGKPTPTSLHPTNSCAAPPPPTASPFHYTATLLRSPPAASPRSQCCT